ncbi:TonB-dependent receptor [Alteraurantiacibacter buctensis]|uniref:TonB-dependent receptor n=1 Tax=Alteraurantiacibacter buctensis TaxID=1503981 RepID=A0A844YUF4_9SPHN|nr:TonB-dependent receptor [Alteraurantiacibacter buctensis]MXO70732.1 TonB-dependent receptor [Alteraurantiacibacter buctensis]
MAYRTPRRAARTWLALGISAIALSSTSAWAQDEEDDERGDTIVVTAQFREQNLQDTPLAITAVTAEILEAKSQTDLATIADSAPNVQIRPQTAAFGPSVTASIRGIGQGDFNPAYEPGVGIYIDDIYYPSLTGAIFDTLDLDRVEILRGPQGTLSGRNSIGGAVKMYSRMPNGDSSGMVEGSYGSRDRISLRGAADFALTSNLFMRISGVSKRQDGYVDQLDFGCVYPAGGSATFFNGTTNVPRNPAGGEARRIFTDNCRVARLGGTNYQAGRAILRWEPSDSFNYTLIADYTDDHRTGSGQVLISTRAKTSANVRTPGGLPFDDRFVCGRFCNFQVDGHTAGVFNGSLATNQQLSAVNGDNTTSYRGWGVSGQGNLDLTDNLQLVSITGYREFDTQFFADGDISPAQTGYGINNLSNWSFSQELRLNAELTDALFVTLGAYYFEQSSVYDSVQDLRYLPTNALQFRQPDTVGADAKAVFANVGWEIMPDLNLNAGIRYTEETKDQHYFRYNLDGTINRFLDPFGAAYGPGFEGPNTLNIPVGPQVPAQGKALTGAVANYQGDKIDWRVALDYRFSDAFMAYASVSTGFKGGGSNPRPFNAFQLLSFAPETLTAYEIGFKSDLFDRRLRVNVSAFQNEYDDIQVGVSPCPLAAGVDAVFATPSACRINGGNARIKGLELEMNAEPVDGLRLDGSVSYIDFTYQTVTPPILITDEGTGMPEWKWSIGAQYEIDLGGSGSLTPRFDVNHQDVTFTGYDGTGVNRLAQFLPAFTVANARLTWRNEDRDLSVALEVTNLFDSYYFYSVFDQRNNNGGRIGAPARPREWALTVRKDF